MVIAGTILGESRYSLALLDDVERPVSDIRLSTAPVRARKAERLLRSTSGDFRLNCPRLELDR
jgi:hypothetical protein